MGLTFQDINGCNCSLTCNTLPCPLPQGTINWSILFPGPHIVSGTSPYTTSVAGNPGCFWTSPCTISGVGQSFILAIAFLNPPGTVTTVSLSRYSNNTCAGAPALFNEWASDGSATTLTLASFNCSTPQMVFNVSGANPTITITW